jgi:AcrR family transcriptional regulator
VNLDNPSSSLTYKSVPIVERRRRILREARLMIAEAGHENFSIRELARRAGVAQKTLYNAFGSKAGIVSSAIVQFAQDLLTRIDVDEEHPSLRNSLTRMVYFNHNAVKVRSYMIALMAITNSPTADPEIGAVVRSLSTVPNLRLARVLAAAGELADGITPEIFAERIVSFINAAHTDWCVGRISDSRFLAHVCECFLIGFIGLTGGAAREEAEVWLTSIRTHSDPWESLLERTLLASAKLTAMRGRGKSLRTAMAPE